MALTEVVEQIHGDGESVIVFDRGQYRCLRMASNDELVQGYRHHTNPFDFRSEYLAAHLAATAMVNTPKRALCLGLGVGATPQLLRQVYPDIAITVVELNDTVTLAAHRFFGLDSVTDLEVIIDCAARYLAKTPPATYDLVFIDCYDESGIPAECSTDAFFESLHQRVDADGLLIANLLPNRRGVSKAFASHQRAFRHTVIVPGVRKTNRTLFGTAGQLPSGSIVRKRIQAMQPKLASIDLMAPWLRAMPAKRYLGRF